MTTLSRCDREIVQARGMRLPPGFYDRDAVRVAHDLVGAWLQVGETGGTIVETEAYRSDDMASHSHRGKTARNAAMFGPAGHAYVYRSYGLHWCFNVVCRPASAVLIRAIEPEMGVPAMMRRRRMDDMRKLSAGPGRLTSALGIDGSLDGLTLENDPFLLALGLSAPLVIAGPRVGITRDVDRPWRFGLKDTRFLSRAFR